jgi:hypothetical protein
MREIEAEVRGDRRARLLTRGGPPEYKEEAMFAAVERILRRALEERDHDALLGPELLNDQDDWRPATTLKFSSHRPVIGPVLVFVKKHMLLPLTRWLYEYALENFRRQQRVNKALFACVEELALENARLRRDIASLSDGPPPRPPA